MERFTRPRRAPNARTPTRSLRSRTRPSAAACPNCRKLISANARECIHCGYEKPAAYTQLPVLGGLLREELFFTNRIILLAAGLYVLALALDLPFAMQFGGPFSLLSPSSQALSKLGMGGWEPLQVGRWWTLLTATYLHSGLLYIAFNLLWLRQLGPLVEELYGPSRFVILYTAAGLMASIVSVLFGANLFTGASGAAFGLFGALVYYGYHRGGLFRRSLFHRMLSWAIIGLVLGLGSLNVNTWGHLGGFAAGAAAAHLLSYQEAWGQKLGHHLGAFAVVILVAICFLFMVGNFFLG